MKTLGYYINCDDAMCRSCFHRLYVLNSGNTVRTSWAIAVAAWKAKGGFENWAEPIAIFRDVESDTPTHCVECYAPIPHALTRNGYAYVEEAARENLGIMFQANGEDMMPNAHSVRVVHGWLGEYTIAPHIMALHNALFEYMDDRGMFNLSDA